MKNLFKVSILVFFAFISSTISFADSTSINNGLTWLASAQNSDGSFGITETSMLDTTNVLDTLKLLQPTSTTYLTGVTWLGSQGVTSTDFLARQIMSLSSAGTGITSDLTSLIDNVNTDNGWGGDISSTSMIDDTALALSALKSVNYSNQTAISNAVLYLVTNQNTDGGWGFYAGDDSNVYMTALVLQVFDELKTTYNLSYPISNAAQYLLSHQNSDGGFGSSPSTVYETALSFLALLGSGQGQALPLQEAVNYITSTQSSDGSWNDDAYSTALALRALGSYLPNLYINSNEIGVSYTSITVGSPVSVSAILHNNGGLGATNVTVALVITGANGASSTVDSTIVPSIDPDGSQALSFSWNTLGYTGKNTVCVVADPDNRIEELDKADNSGCITFDIGNLPDLIVPSSGISFTSTDGTHVTITASVYNMGESPAIPFNVGIYDGSTAKPIAIINVAGLGTGQRVTVSTVWNASSTYGYHNILVIADPDDAIEEITKANNIGSQGYWIRPTLDLAISSTDITVDPSTPLYSGEQFTLNITVHNYGSQEADNVLVTAQPTYSDMQLTDAYVNVPGGGTALAQIPGIYRGSDTMNSESVRITVDPYNQFQELTKSNNSATAIIPIATSVVELGFVPANDYTGDGSLNPIIFSPQFTSTGQIINISVRLKTLSSAPSQPLNVPVGFYNGDPDNGGVQIGMVTAAISSTSTTPTVSIQWAPTASSQVIYVRIDPENLFQDPNRPNHTAYKMLSIAKTDLFVSYRDFSFTPFAPLPGQSFTISVGVHNNSNTDATGILHLYQGNPDSNAYLQLFGGYEYSVNHPIDIASLPISVTAGSAVTVNVPWVLQQGSQNIYAVVDHVQPEDININNISIYNNSTNKSVYMKYIVDPGPPVPFYETVDLPFDILEVPIFSLGDLSGGGKPEIVTNERDLNGESIRVYDIDSDSNWKQLTRIPVDWNDGDDMTPGLINTGEKREMIYLNVPLGTYYQTGATNQYAIAYDMSGNILWRTLLSYGAIRYTGGTPAFGDVNGDGITDVVIPSISGSEGSAQCMINVLDTRTGNIIWSKALPYTFNNGFGDFQSTIVDLNGDGKNEVIASYGGSLTVFHSDGTIWWQLPNTNYVYVTGFVITDLNMDGKPEIIVQRLNDFNSYNPTRTIEAYSSDGTLLWTYNTGKVYGFGAIAAGDINDDGFPEIVFFNFKQSSNNNTTIDALDHHGNLLWEHALPDYPPGTTDIYGPSLILGDLYGDGTLQVIVARDWGGLIVLDGKTGNVLNDFKRTTENGATYGNLYCVYPAAVDVDGDGVPEISSGYRDYFNISYIEHKMLNQIEFFSSPQQWHGHVPRHQNEYPFYVDQVDDNLNMTGDYQPWKTYNSWNAQFVPYKLLPDLYITSTDISISPTTVGVNSPASLSVNVHNIGAVTATTFNVGIYDGDPQNGGTLITEQTIPSLDGRGVTTITSNVTFNTNGMHLVYVSLDPEDQVKEMRKNNNIAFLPVIVSSYLPDIAVNAISFTPTSPVLGMQVSISANISNNGLIGADNIPVYIYDGDPNSGGTLITSTTIGSLITGADTTVSALYMPSYSGNHYIYVEADPNETIPDLDYTNNTGITQMYVEGESDVTLPDLAVYSNQVSVSDSSPAADQTITVTVPVHNFGTAVSNVQVGLYQGNTQLGMTTIYQIIPFGTSVPVSFSLNTFGMTGVQNLSIVADPNNLITESNETNNTAPFTIDVNSTGLGITVAADNSIYTADSNVMVSTYITNTSNAPVDTSLNVAITDNAGNPAGIIASNVDVSLPANGFTALTFTWNTGSIYPGAYKAVGTLIESGNTAATSYAPFSILPQVLLSSMVTANKISYNANETAIINGTVNNLSANTMLSGDSMEISVLGPSGALVGGYSASMPLLMPDASFSSKYDWNTGTSPSGTYQAVLKVLDSTGTLLTQATTSFGINSTENNLASITGVISIAPQILESGNNISVSYSITNSGNAGVSITPSVMLVSPQANPGPGQAFTIDTTSASIATASTYANTFTYPVTCQMFGDYIAALQASDTKTVAQTWFRVVDLTPPVVTITGVVDNGCYNTPSPDITITDCHLSSSSIQLNGNAYVSGTPISSNGNDVLTATGSDLGGNITTKSVHFTVDTIAPLITITGVTAGATYTASVTPTITITDANLVSSTTTLDGQPYVSGTPIIASGKHVLTVSAADCAGNQSSQSISFMIMSVNLDVIKSLITPPGVLIFDMGNDEGGVCGKGFNDAGVTPSVPLKLRGMKGSYDNSGQLISELTTLLTNAGYYYRVTNTWDEFETAFDTGLYNRYILIDSVSTVEDKDTEHENLDSRFHGNDTTEGIASSWHNETTPRNDIIEELREAVNMGDGMVVIKSNPDDLPWLKDVTGVQWLGQTDDGQKALGNLIVELKTALAPSAGTMTLTGQHAAVNMTLTTASMAGYYSQTTHSCHSALDAESSHGSLDSRFHGNDGKGNGSNNDVCTCKDDKTPFNPPYQGEDKTYVAIAVNAYGMGESVSMGFDPSYISETTQAQNLILNALGFVGPNYQYMPNRLYPSSTQGIQISVTNLGAAVGLNITESVPASVGIGQVFNNGTITDSSILWHYALPVSASATFSYTVTLPQTASSYTFTTGIWYNNGPQLTQYGSYPFTVTVTIEPKALLKQIISDVQSLRVKRADEENKEEVLELLNKLQTEQDTIQPQEAVEKLLKAIDELMEIKSADITQIRLNLDVGLRIYEARITGVMLEH